MLQRKRYNTPAVESAIRGVERILSLSFRDLRKYLLEELAKLERDGNILRSSQTNIRHIRHNVIPNLQAQIRELGFGQAMQAQTDGLLGITRDILGEAEEKNLSGVYRAETGGAIEALLFGAGRRMYAQEGELAGVLEQLLIRSATGNPNWEDLVQRISKQLEIHESHARIKAADTVATFHRHIRTRHFQDNGVKWFLFDGPNDDRKRLWCSHFIHTRVTTQILDRYADKWDRPNHPAPPSQSLGAWNCRDELIPLVDEEEINRWPIGPR